MVKCGKSWMLGFKIYRFNTRWYVVLTVRESVRSLVPVSVVMHYYHTDIRMELCRLCW